MTTTTPTRQQPVCPADDEVLQQSFVTAYAQLNSVKKRLNLDDLELRLIDNCTAAIEQIQIDTIQRLNYETDSYNLLADEIEKLQVLLSGHTELQEEVAKIRSEAISSIEEAQAAAQQTILEAEGRAIQANNRADSLQSSLTTSQLSVTSLTQEFRQYQRKYPERMLRDIEERDKTISEMRAKRKRDSKLRQELQSKLNQCDVVVGQERRKNADLTQELLKSDTLYRHLKERIALHDGHENIRQFLLQLADGSGDVACYIYNYHSGLSVFNGIRNVSIETANFHYQIRTEIMLAMDVVPGVWGNPVFRIVPELLPIWDTAINDELQERITSRIALDYPRLHQRILDGRAAPLSELVLPARIMNVLVKNRYDSVAEVASELPGALATVKGLSDASEAEIRASVNSWCIRWSRENGDVENIKANVRKPH